MAKGYPWSLSAALKYGDTDPDVIVQVGPVYTADEGGGKVIKAEISNPQTMKLSALPAFLASAVAEGVTLKEPFVPPTPPTPPPPTTL